VQRTLHVRAMLWKPSQSKYLMQPISATSTEADLQLRHSGTAVLFAGLRLLRRPAGPKPHRYQTPSGLDTETMHGKLGCIAGPAL